MSDGEPQVTHTFSYALNPNSGKVHLVAVTRGRIALSGAAARRVGGYGWRGVGANTPPPAAIEGADGS